MKAVCPTRASTGLSAREASVGAAYGVANVALPISVPCPGRFRL